MLEYIVKNEDEKFPEDATRFKGVMEHPADLAEEAAAEYHNRRDGWEASWPVTFEIFRDGKSLGTFEVEREQVPQFHATKQE